MNLCHFLFPYCCPIF